MATKSLLKLKFGYFSKMANKIKSSNTNSEGKTTDFDAHNDTHLV
jgi:hypothetical protein